MKKKAQDTIYMLGPILTFLLLLSYMLTPLIDNIKEMNTKLIAYSECSSKMIDYAFMGKVLNFTKCYIEKSQNVTDVIHCKYVKNKIVCMYKEKKYVYIVPFNYTIENK